MSNSLSYDTVRTDPVIVMPSERVVTEETPRFSFIRTFSDFKLNNLYYVGNKSEILQCRLFSEPKAPPRDKTFRYVMNHCCVFRHIMHDNVICG